MLKQKSFFEKSSDSISDAGEKLGILLMSAAVVTGMLEFSDHQTNKIVLPNQPILSFASDNSGNNPLRREKGSEEAGVTHISYSIAQRTPSRSSR
jgi:hypothetical protein